MRTLIVSLITAGFAAALGFAPARAVRDQQPDDKDHQKAAIESELKSLSADLSRLQSPLSRAVAEIEIADALWDLNRLRARALLVDAYTLTLAPRDAIAHNLAEQKSAIRGLRPSTEQDRARNSIRARIMNIARKDQELVNRLNEMASGNLSKKEQSSIHSTLARSSYESGDVETAKQNISEALEIDPVHGCPSDVINDLALKDRLAADVLILQYIQNIRRTSLLPTDYAVAMVYLTLSQLVFPNSMFPDPNKPVPLPGSAVMRAYASYVLDLLSGWEQSAPGTVMRNRTFLLSTWFPIKDNAPELMGAFLELEKLSRKPGEPSSVPTQTAEQREKEWYEKRKKAALDANQADVSAINSLINRGDFDDARTAIDKLPDGAQKSQLLEKTNVTESLRLLTRGDIPRAAHLASRLRKANSMLTVYSAIIQKCVEKQDNICATNLIREAVKQLRTEDKTEPSLPAGIPKGAIPSRRESDPVVQSLGIFAIKLVKVDRDLALDVLDEMVLAANKSDVDSELGQPGFNSDVFRKLAAVDEIRVRRAADNLVGLLKRVVALAAISKSEVDRLNQAPPRPVGGAKNALPENILVPAQ
jgi:hypothetical protein